MVDSNLISVNAHSYEEVDAVSCLILIRFHGSDANPQRNLLAQHALDSPDRFVEATPDSCDRFMGLFVRAIEGGSNVHAMLSELIGEALRDKSKICKYLDECVAKLLSRSDVLDQPRIKRRLSSDELNLSATQVVRISQHLFPIYDPRVLQKRR
jgi:hypothetical protein